MRLQDLEDNKYLAAILRTIQAAQLERDQKNFPFLTLRAARLRDSIAQRRAGT